MPPKLPNPRSAAALAAREYRVQLLAELFRLYDNDGEFGDGLRGLIPLAADADVVQLASPSSRSHDRLFEVAGDQRSGAEGAHPRIVQIRAFVSAVDAIAQHYGLDRLGGDGRAQIVAWCDRFLRAQASGSMAPSTYGPERLSTARAWFGFEPEVIGVVGPPWRREEWAPTRETRGAARKRLERIASDHIRAQLDQIEGELADLGIVLPRKVPNLERDVRWLFLKLRHGKSFQEIYNACQPPPDGGVETVRKAVVRIAQRLKVNDQGWESGWR